MFICRGAEYIGVEYLSACLKARGHLTELAFDPGFDDTFYFRAPFLKCLNRWPALIRRVNKFKPDVLAVSSVSNTYPYITKLIREIKETYHCYTVIGGVHASAVPEQLIQSGLFDAVCMGEGEEALTELLGYLEGGERPTTLKNFYFSNRGKFINNPLRPLIENLDSLPFPDKSIFYKYGAFSTTLALISGRGCPYSCAFCINEQWKRIYRNLGRFIRRYSPKRMLDEIQYFVKRYPVKRINFQDDIFTMGQQWLEQFCELYRRFINLPFQCNTHPLFVSEESARILAASGCASVCMGIQTAVEKKRREILNRAETNEQINDAVAVLKRHNLPVYLEYIFGLPQETLEDISENIIFNRSLKPNNTATFVLYPFPGTAILRSCQESKIINKHNLSRVINGEGSYHYDSLIGLPHKSASESAAALFPLFTRMPESLSVFLVRIFSYKYLQWLREIIHFLSLPFNNFFQFRERISNYYGMFCRCANNKDYA